MSYFTTIEFQKLYEKKKGKWNEKMARVADPLCVQPLHPAQLKNDKFVVFGALRTLLSPNASSAAILKHQKLREGFLCYYDIMGEFENNGSSSARIRDLRAQIQVSFTARHEDQLP